MKNVSTFLFVVASFYILWSCSSDGGPEAEDFINHLAKKEWTEAQRLMTAETAPMMAIIEGMAVWKCLLILR